MRWSRGRVLVFVAIGLGTFALAFLLHRGGLFQSLDRSTIDLRFAIRGEHDVPDDLVVVKIDDATFHELHQQWPFRRITHADLIDRIAADKPKVIAYDVQFSERSTDHPGDDERLAGSIGKAGGRVVLATTEVNDKGEGNFLGTGQDFLVNDLHGRFGNALLPSDPGEVYRRVDYQVAKMKTFAVAAVETATHRQVDPDQFGGDTWIDYHGPPNTLRSVSFGDVIKKKVPRGFFHDKLVVVGPYAPSLQDTHKTSTTTGSDQQMSGAEIQANAIDTVRRGVPLHTASTAVDVLVLAVFSFMAPAASALRSPLWTMAVVACLGALYLLILKLAFDADTILPAAGPVIALGLSSFFTLGFLFHFTQNDVAQQRVRDVFARFAPEQVVDQALARAGEDLRLGGVRRDGTVMFADLRSFTTFAEALAPDQVIDVLNRYLGEMTDAIMAKGGTLVSFMGDGIMAVFGAPIEQPDHADRALAAAREMVGPGLSRFNTWIRAQGLGEGFRMGIGLNSGSVMSGQVGSERRLEYTAVGDTTNTAARLEAMTKNGRYQLFVADSTRQALQPGADSDLVFVDEFVVRGKDSRIGVWTIRSSLSEPGVSF
jgi:adenylate cyclase